MRPLERFPSRVSVVVAAAEPWPGVQPFVDAVLPEVRSLGGELVIGAADAGVLPEGHRPPGVRVAVAGPRRTTSPFALRAAALGCADGALVVVTENHCRPTPGWLAAYVAVQAEHGAATLFAGPVLAGEAEAPAHWANYLIVCSPFAPPLDAFFAERCPSIANCAIAGRVVRARAAELQRPGWFERGLVPELYRAGGCVPVPAASVAHVQNLPAWRHMALHFHDARCAGAFAATADPSCRPGIDPRSLGREVGQVLAFVDRVVALRPALRGERRRAAFWLRALAFARVLGLAVGTRWGAGGSAERVD